MKRTGEQEETVIGIDPAQISRLVSLDAWPLNSIWRTAAAGESRSARVVKSAVH